MKITLSNILTVIFIVFAIMLGQFHSVDSKSVRVHTSQPKLRTSTSIPKLYSKRDKITRKQTTPRRPNAEMPKYIKNRVDAIGKQDISHTHSPSQQNNNDPIQVTFDSGIQRVFKYIREILTSESPISSENEELELLSVPEFKPPVFFPSNFPFSKTFDYTNLIKLLDAPSDSDVEHLAENAIVDVISQLVGLIGINDLREWMGIMLVSFLLGPIMIPLYWLPVSFFGMVGLLVPLFLFNPPSKLNTNVMGHDPIVPETGQEEKRSSQHFSFSTVITKALNRSVVEANISDTIRNSTGAGSDSTSYLDSCVERFVCQVTRIYRDNPISQWLARRFNSTKVEWARFLKNLKKNDDADDDSGLSSETKLSSQSRENCKKYSCPVMFPFAT